MASETGWSDELKQSVVQEYMDCDPTPETSMDIVKELAEKFEKTPNGVRMVLTKAGVYVKKEPSASSAKDNGDKPKKISKADAVAMLKKEIEGAGAEYDDKIVSKITGIAALYFANVIKTAKQG